jgi:hypothetical protein
MSLISRNRTLCLLLWATSGLAAAGCASDACRRQSTLDIGAPGGRVRAIAYHGGCAPPETISTLTLMFRGAHERKTIVIAERLRVVRLQWVSAERLEVDYRSANPGVIREQQVRVGSDSVRVVLKGVAGRVR